ncbi:hypothetical protein B5F83_06640 [Muribaculum sp. An289]|nr:hypothetical protein B5F83_06640 [Muribaculum sp. An289]OUO42542.1 hypothetical protein B5F81_07095 [Muribaculum sp. An287]
MPLHCAKGFQSVSEKSQVCGRQTCKRKNRGKSLSMGEIKPFLRQVAEICKDRILDRNSRVCLVFPSRRSTVFFRQYLSEIMDKPFFSPELITINELFGKISDLRVADRITLLQRLYACYSEIVPEPESLDSFVFWGDMLVSDFNDVDKYMVDARSLFMNVSDLNALKDDFSYLTEKQREAIKGFWGHYFGNGVSVSDGVRKNFSSNWRILFPLYERFRALLGKEGIAYDGMLYRQVAEKLRAGSLEPLEGYGTVVFIGLNALNECEKVLLKHFMDEGRADFYWDFCGSMLRDEKNAASLFMKENIKDFPSRYVLDDSDVTAPCIQAVSVPSAVGEAKYAGEILSSLGDGIGRETAVVLPDSSLLAPLLSAIPQNVSSINVTMGCPMGGSALYSFMRSLKELHLHSRRLPSGKMKFYHRNVIDLLHHRYLCSQPGVQDTIKTIFSCNMVYVEPELPGTSPLLKTVFRVVIDDFESTENTGQLADYCKDVLWELGVSAPSIDREFIKKYLSAVVKIADMRLPVRPATWFRLTDTLVAGATVPFKGEPLSGIQIMGPLETRALDFKNVIITSMNEGLFPSNKNDSSFIPFVLRKGFGLPTYEYEDAIWAYYFYRLISRAEKVFLISDTRVEGLKGGGESRYVKQIEYLYSDKAVFSRKNVSFFSGPGMAPQSGQVVKTPEISSLMEKIFFEDRTPFSYSSLNDYVTCPLKFYYAHVAREIPEEELVDDVDYSSFGRWYHLAMQTLYGPWVGREMTRQCIEKMISDRDALSAVVDESFSKITQNTEIRGANLINREIILRLVEKTLEADAGFAPLKIAGLERWLTAPFSLDDGRHVMLGGFIDRLDICDGRLRIIDYKTGAVDLKYKDVSEVFDKGRQKRPGIILQLFIYRYLLEHAGQSMAMGYPMAGVIYSLKEIFRSSPQEFCFTDGDYSSMRKGTASLIEEILDPAVPFTEGPSAKCEYCDFASICKKTEV